MRELSRRLQSQFHRCLSVPSLPPGKARLRRRITLNPGCVIGLATAAVVLLAAGCGGGGGGAEMTAAACQSLKQVPESCSGPV